VFRAINGLPNSWYTPLRAVGESGNFAAIGVSAGTALLAGRRRLAAELAFAGTLAWAGAKIVKRLGDRGRPASYLDGIVIHGDVQAGGGFVSGHAAVATAILTVAGRRLAPRHRLARAAVVGVVGIYRVYVGAHLPLDVIGGAALGGVSGTVSDLVFGSSDPAERA